MSASGYEYVPTPANEPPAAARHAPAKWWNRVGATIFDNLVIGIPGAIIIAVVASGDSVRQFGTRTVLLLVLVVYSVLMLAYRGGQTLGKQVASVRVLDEDHRPVGLGRALGRELLKAIFQITFLIYVVDVLWPLWQPENRALHDLVAGTRVVRTDEGDPPPSGYYDA